MFELATSYGLSELDSIEFRDVDEDIRQKYKELAYRAQVLYEEMCDLVAEIADRVESYGEEEDEEE